MSRVHPSQQIGIHVQTRSNGMDNNNQNYNQGPKSLEHLSSDSPNEVKNNTLKAHVTGTAYQPTQASTTNMNQQSTNKNTQLNGNSGNIQQQKLQKQSFTQIQEQKQPVQELQPVQGKQQGHSSRQMSVFQSNEELPQNQLLKHQSQTQIPQQEQQAQSQDSRGVPDVFMLIIFVLSFIAWIGLGIHAFKASDPFDKVEKDNDMNGNSITKGFYIVVISFGVSYIVGLIALYCLYKNSFRTFQLSIAFSIIALICLTVYAFAQKYLAVGIVAAVCSVLSICIGLSINENASIIMQLSELIFQFRLLKKKYLIMYFFSSIIVLLELVFSLICVVNIIFSAASNKDKLGVYLFFGFAFCFLSYWIVGSTISLYCFTVSRKCAKWFYSPSNQKKSQLRSDEIQASSQRQINQNDNQINSHNPQRTDQIEDVENKTLNVIRTQTNMKSLTVIPVQRNNQNTAESSNQREQQQQQTNQIPSVVLVTEDNEQEDNRPREVKGETIFQILKITFQKTGSIVYSCLVSQVSNLLSFILKCFVYGTGLFFLIGDQMKECNSYFTRLRAQLSIVRLSVDAPNYNSSFQLVSGSLKEKNYLFVFSLWGINEICTVIGFFTFIVGFVVGVILLINLDMADWYITALFIFLVFIIVLQAANLITSNYQMIVYTTATMFSIEKKKKSSKKSDKYIGIQNIMYKAYKLQKEPIPITDLY